MSRHRAARILLINTDVCPTAKVYPIGLDYLTSRLQDNGFLVDALDLAFMDPPDWLVAAKKALVENNYLAVGVGIRNLYDELFGGRNYLPEIVTLVRGIRKELKKKKRETKIILGGSGFSLMPITILKASGADFGVMNEGEAATLILLEGLREGKKFTQTIFTESFDVTPVSYRRGSWGNFHGYFRWGSSGNLQTKRGCPMQCLYCEYPAIEGIKFRFRDPTLVAEEFIQLERLGFPRIYMVDATFNNPMSQAKEVLIAMKNAGTTRPWSGFFNPRQLDQELIDLIKATHGGDPLKITIESGSDVMLAALQKSFRRVHIEQAVELCRKNSMKFSFTLLFGGPGENKQTVAETCALIRKAKPTYATMNIGIYLHPKTYIAQRTRGQLWKTEDDFMQPIVYPCDRNQIKEWVSDGLTGSGVSYNIYEGGEK